MGRVVVLGQLGLNTRTEERFKAVPHREESLFPSLALMERRVVAGSERIAQPADLCD